jgi:hypothetical protein
MSGLSRLHVGGRRGLRGRLPAPEGGRLSPEVSPSASTRWYGARRPADARVAWPAGGGYLAPMGAVPERLLAIVTRPQAGPSDGTGESSTSPPGGPDPSSRSRKASSNRDGALSHGRSRAERHPPPATWASPAQLRQLSQCPVVLRRRTGAAIEGRPMPSPTAPAMIRQRISVFDGGVCGGPWGPGGSWSRPRGRLRRFAPDD